MLYQCQDFIFDELLLDIVAMQLHILIPVLLVILSFYTKTFGDSIRKTRSMWLLFFKTESQKRAGVFLIEMFLHCRN